MSGLMYAAWNGQTEVVEHLLTLGASPQLQNGEGRTALGLAITAHHMEIVRVLNSSDASELAISSHKPAVWP